MRWAACSLVLIAMGAGACGAITGIGDYVQGGDDASVTVDPLQDATGDRGSALGDDSANQGDGGGNELEAGGDSAGSSDAGDDSTVAADTGAGSDATTGPDAPDLDAGRGADTSTRDAAPPACTASNCGGCCKGGTCFGGGSTSTCGTGGGACASCAGSTPTCANGSCIATPKDAGPPPMCTMDSDCNFKALCIPAYQIACCKSDGTCGCEITFSGNCM